MIMLKLHQLLKIQFEMKQFLRYDNLQLVFVYRKIGESFMKIIWYIGRKQDRNYISSHLVPKP